MLIPIRILERVWNVHPTGVLHVGAHLAEESVEYDEFKWGEQFGIHWIEAQKDLADTLRKRFAGSRNTIYEGVVWDKSNEILTFNVSNNSQSSSLFQFGTHSSDYPEVVFQSERQVKTITIADLIPGELKFDLINLDIQGAELNALKGLGARLAEVRWIYTEVNSREVYKGCSTIGEIDSFLAKNDFIRVQTVWVKGAGWGDALYVRTSLSGVAASIKLKAIRVQVELEAAKLMRRVVKLLKIIFHHLRG